MGQDLFAILQPFSPRPVTENITIFDMGLNLKERMLMKAPKPVQLTLTSLMILSPMLGVISGIEPARADDDWFEEVRENCQRVNSGYFCRDSRIERSSRGRYDPFGNRSRRDDIYRRNDSRYDIREGRIYEGAVIETRTYNNDRFEVRRKDSRSLTLLVDKDIRSDTDNYVLIPKGSRIFGKLKSHDGGVRYEADYITLFNGKRYDLDARSETIYPRGRRSNSRVSSSAANIILGTILSRGGSRSDSTIGNVIRGGDIFSSSRNRSRNDDYVSINPKNDLDLRLTNDFRIRD